MVNTALMLCFSSLGCRSLKMTYRLDTSTEVTAAQLHTTMFTR